MRFWVIIAGVLGLIVLLKWQFPYAGSGQDQMLRITYLALLLVLIASGSRLLSRSDMPQMLRHAALWMGIILLLVLGYSFRDLLPYKRLMGELIPSSVQISESGALSVRSSEGGHFHLVAEVNGIPVKFMIDTGASDIVLSPGDAAATGFDIRALNYSRIYQTANGTVSGAPVRIETMAIGPLTFRNIPASVNGAEMGGSLLGMSFLRQFSSYSVEGDTLTLKP